MPKLNIVYHIKSNYKTIKDSILSLCEQEDKNFNIVFIDDNMNKEAHKLLSKLDTISQFKNVNFMSLNEPAGHSFCFNTILGNLPKEDYVYFCAPNVIFKPNFVSKIKAKFAEGKNPNVILFGVYSHISHNNLNEFSKTQTLNLIFNYFLENYTNKIYSVDFLSKNNICFVPFVHYSLLFNFETYIYLKQIDTIDESIAEIAFVNNPSYNLYDLINQISVLLNKYKDSKIYLKYKDIFDYIFIRTILFKFLILIYCKFYHHKNNSLKIGIKNALEFLNTDLPEWEKNKYLNSRLQFDNPIIVDYLKDFKGISSLKKICNKLKYDKKTRR